MCQFESLKINPNNKIKSNWTQNSLLPPWTPAEIHLHACREVFWLILSSWLCLCCCAVCDTCVRAIRAPSPTWWNCQILQCTLAGSDWLMAGQQPDPHIATGWAALPQQDWFQITQHLLLFDKQHLARLLLMDCCRYPLKAFIWLSACFKGCWQPLWCSFVRHYISLTKLFRMQ